MNLQLVAASVILTASIVTAHSAVVTTTNNASAPGDGQISLLEALTAATANETISFNIPGAGPHYIITPEGGYPFILQSGVTIDGFSQPGASANTAAPRQPRNEVLKIVLDSRTEEPNTRRTVIDIDPGFGDSESCVLGFRNAQGVTVRGLAFIGVGGQGTSSDAHVYNIALIEASTNAKVQGCWFGLDPGQSSWLPGPDGVVPGVYGARSAVASFKGSGGSSSAGLIFGTDGNGTGDAGEGNICVAQRLAVHLETPSVRVSGNWFNFFPNGSYLNPATQNLVLEDGSMEAIENGDGTNMTIGTNGDGVSDLEEGKRFGPVVYDVFAEFWRSAVGVIFAGNTVGVNLLGLPAFSSPGTNLLAVRSNSSFRIGSDGNGIGDDAEGNIIAGLPDGFIQWHSSNNNVADKPARISLRRNELINNGGTIPLSQSAPVTAQRLFADAMSNSAGQTNVVISVNSGTSLFQCTNPAPAVGLSKPVIDVYLADAQGLYQSAPQGRVWLKSFVADLSGPDGDINPLGNSTSISVSALGLTAAEVQRLTATATYTLSDGRTVTTNFCNTLSGATTPPEPLGDTMIGQNGSDIQLSWSGGTAPFLIVTATDITGPWSTLTTTPNQFLLTPFNGPRRFYRVYEGARPR